VGATSRARPACVAVGAFLLATLGAARAEELFPRPEALEPAVEFWTRVYTEVDTRSGFVHDSLRLDIVYQTVRFADDQSTRERRRRVERAMEVDRNVLNKLATGARDGLNAEEQRILALFPADTSKAEFRAAASRLRFQLGQSDRFRAGLVRSGTWKPYIYEVLAKNGLPRELAALPHVESSFDPTAYSKVGAAGLWQFTRSTGVRYMRVDHIVDERRDPFFATNAAARLLADNYSVTGTWPLALTAYNHGAAGMRRAVEQQKTTDIAAIVARYQSRSFGFASRNFYAAFLAALEIDTNPERYFGNVRVNAPAATEVLVVPDFVTANTLADALHVREGALRELNPALSEAVWAGDKYVPQGFALRVPRDTAAISEELLAAIGTNDRFAAQRPDREHRVRRGDTLSGIAAEYRVSLAALMRVNGLGGRDLLRVGQLIKLPIDAATSGALIVAREEPARAAVAPPSETAGDSGVYVVRNGDSVERIARRLGVEQAALIAANSLRNQNVIYPGQRLTVPGTAEAESDTLVAAAETTPATLVLGPPLPETETETETEDDALDTGDLEVALAPALLENGQPSEAPADELDDAGANVLASEQPELAADPTDYSVSAGNVITVQAVETLGHYADWLDIPTQRLRDLNGLAFHQSVAIGQKLTLDLSGTDAETFEGRRVAYHQQLQSDFFASHQIEDIEAHVVKPGESLWVLAARKYKVPVWLMRQYNPDLDLDRVQPGIVVKFPRFKDIAPSSAPPAPQTIAASGP
jgi:peptidoglycan lytic transglycosylase D